MKNSGIYIHVPWCRRRCPYCDFYLVVGKPKSDFVDALLKEWEARKNDWQTQADSLYFGGGTPSLLKPLEIERIIEHFFIEKILVDDAEITIEANPEDLLTDYAHHLSKTRVNRISLGLQSFDDEILKLLGRKHRFLTALKAIDSVQAAGFTNISVDLIIGVKGERPSEIIAGLKELDTRGIPHVSAYLLTIEENTRFDQRIRQGRMGVMADDDQAEIYRLVQAELLALGYVQYDVSSYAKEEKFSRHNQKYWAGGGYVGLGPGAHSMRLLPNGSLIRYHNNLLLNDWLKNPSGQGLFEELDPVTALNEALAFGLRNMAYGIDPLGLALLYQTPIPPQFFVLIKKFIDYGWLEEQGSRLKISHHGALFADAIMREILDNKPF